MGVSDILPLPRAPMVGCMSLSWSVCEARPSSHWPLGLRGLAVVTWCLGRDSARGKACACQSLLLADLLPHLGAATRLLVSICPLGNANLQACLGASVCHSTPACP